MMKKLMVVGIACIGIPFSNVYSGGSGTYGGCDLKGEAGCTGSWSGYSPGGNTANEGSSKCGWSTILLDTCGGFIGVNGGPE